MQGKNSRGGQLFIFLRFMLKTIAKSLILLLLFQLGIPAFGTVFAQNQTESCPANPPVCSATPESMQLYLDLQRELTALIQTYPFKTANETISEWEWGIFTNNLLKLEGIKNFDDSLAGQALKIFYVANIRSATASITSAFLFELAWLSTLADNSIGLTILFQDRPIVRDWEKLLDIERNLNQTAYHLGKAGEIVRTISDTTVLKQLLRKYESKGVLEGIEAFSPSLRYMDLLKILTSINIAMKSFLAYNSSNLLNSFKEQGLSFNKKRIQQLKEDYRCTRRAFGFKCSSSWNSLVNTLSLLASTTKNQGLSSRKIIQQASKNLADALLQFPWGVWANIKGQANDAYLTEREKILLRDIYGLDTTKMTKENTLSLLSLSNSTKNQRRSYIQRINSLWKNLSPWYTTLQKRSSESENGLKRFFRDLFSAKNPPQQVYLDTEFATLLVLKLQQLGNARAEAEEISFFSTSNEIGYQFWQLSRILETLTVSIGSKDNHLRKILDEICSYQCSNKGSKGCYVQ